MPTGPNSPLWQAQGVFVDVCVDMCTDICVDVCTNMCTDVCTDIRIDMCIEGGTSRVHHGRVFGPRTVPGVLFSVVFQAIL